MAIVAGDVEKFLIDGMVCRRDWECKKEERVRNVLNIIDGGVIFGFGGVARKNVTGSGKSLAALIFLQQAQASECSST